MKRFSLLEIISIGLAIFSMFFGAGNLLFPLQVGLLGGCQAMWGMLGFIITGVCLPLLSLVTIILFDGNYKAFFYRLGKVPGFLFILFCMLLIGPLYAIPRIVTFSHIMIAPFLGNLSLPLFAAIFLILTFLGCYKEGKILDILGHLVSPALIVSLTIIITKGILGAGSPVECTYASTLNLFWESLKIGYNTLDIIGAIFFSAIVIGILRHNAQKNNRDSSNKALAHVGFQAGLIGVSLLAIVYIGMCYMGAFYGQELQHLNPGEVFSAVSFRILGSSGAIIIAIAVLMACYSTIVPLTAVFSEYIRGLSHHRISYMTALLISLITTGIISTFGLTSLMDWYKPVVDILYPPLIVLSIVNFLYKMWGFDWVKLPVALTLGASLAFKLFQII